MASVSSASSGVSANSIYGNRNVITGLASGIDTEQLIENAVKGYQSKITALQQKYTKVEWKQEAYRSIIDKMVGFSDKYMSYSSKTNLMSASFFNSAVKTAVSGTYASKISATGRTNSDVAINSVSQLAKAASYRTTGLNGLANSGEISGKAIDSSIELSNISGSLTFQYGGSNGSDFTIKFDELEDVIKSEGSKTTAQSLADAINKKLEDINYTYTQNGNPESVKASDAVKAVVGNDGKITFQDGLGKGNKIYISSATGDLKTNLGISPGKDTTSINTTYDTKLNKTLTTAEYLKDKSLSFNFNGTSKSIDMNDILKTAVGEDGKLDSDKLKTALQDKADSLFGKNKVTVTTEPAGDGGFKLNFGLKNTGDTLSVSGSAAKALGFENGDATHVNTGAKLSQLYGDKISDIFKDENRIEATGNVTKSSKTGKLVDEDGNTVEKVGNKYYRVDDEGKALYDFNINGKTIAITKDTTVESLINKVNSSDAGVKMSYSTLTNEFTFTATETGANSKVKLEGVAAKLFGTPGEQADSTYTAGQDAILNVTVNGKEMTLTRSTNSVDLDGLNVTLKGTFEAKAKEDGEDYEPITFTTSADSDAIVDAVKSMIADYNEMATEIKQAYSTTPAQKSNGARYNPLTDEDKEGMSESAIASYEEKAKQGILFGDSNLSMLYNQMLNAVSNYSLDGKDLRDIGITTSYSNGITTMQLDEDKLRSALESDPDKVKNAFTKSTESGASSNGLMQSLKRVTDTYAGTTGATKGVLIEYAGSVKAYTSINKNYLQNQLNSLESQMSKWQTKISDKIDYYTKKFTALETLIAQMNSQSSTLAGLMGTSY